MSARSTNRHGSWRRRVLGGLALMAAASVVGSYASKRAEAADRRPIEGARAPLSSFYDWTALDALENGAPGVALIDEESCSIDENSQPSEFAGNMLLNCDTLGIRNETTVAVNPLDPDNVVAGSHRYRLLQKGGTVVVHIVSTAFVTKDGGASWLNVVPPIGEYQFFGDPALAFDSQGNVYYAFIADHEGQGGLFTNVSIVVYRSSNGGVSWEGPVTVAAGNGGVVGPQDFNDKVYIAVDTNPASPFLDRIYVTWTRFLTGPAGRYVESPIYVSSSADGGLSFSAPQEISGASAALCPVQLGDDDGRCDEDQFSQPVVGPDGTVYVAFENFQAPGSDQNGFRGQMLLVRSSDGGASWQGPFHATAVIDGEGDYPTNSDGRQTLSGCAMRVHAAGNVTVDRRTGTLYLVWDDNRNGTASKTDVDVFLSSSTDQGATWSTPSKVNAASGKSDQFYPWASVGPEGEVVVGYMDRRYQAPGSCQYGFTLSVSGNGGKSFQSKRVDTGISRADDSRWFSQNTRFIGDYNNVAVGSDGNAWAVWTDMRRDVTFLGITRAGQDAVAAKVPLGKGGSGH